MLSGVKKITVKDIDQSTLYTVEYLEKDDNTNRYTTKKEILKGSDLFYEDEHCNYCHYQITDIQKYIIDEHKLYTLSNFYSRPYFEDDERLIDMGNWETIITRKPQFFRLSKTVCNGLLSKYNSTPFRSLFNCIVAVFVFMIYPVSACWRFISVVSLVKVILSWFGFGVKLLDSHFLITPKKIYKNFYPLFFLLLFPLQKKYFVL